MLAQAEGRTDIPLLDETIGQRFEATVRRLPEHEALVMPHQDIRWSYGRLDAEVNRVARGLLARGIQAGERVGVWAPNLVEWVLMQFATAKIGAIQVNINPAYRRDELAYALRQSGCRLLVAARRFKSSDYAGMIADVRGECPQLEQVVLLDEPGQPADWAALLAAGEAQPTDAVAQRMATLKPDDAINIQYTSGTTGSPKGATLSHRNILNNAYFAGLQIGFNERERMVIPVPFYHCAGMVVGNLLCVIFGATMVVPAPSFEPGATLAAISSERCTAAMCVPTMYIAMLAHPDCDKTDFSTLRTGTIGGSPCPVELMNILVTKFHLSEITIVFGMTETSPIATQTAMDDPLEKRVASVGRVHPHVQIRIVDADTGEVCGIGQTGEFQTRGYSVMKGYWNDPKRTADAITPEGWMRTGDLATMDEQGYVNVVGRIKDMIIRGGENIYPREIEEFLYTHPDIREVQVIGVPDEKFGEEVMATVIMKEGTTPLTQDSLRAFCRDRIAHYKIPRYLEVMREFPMTVSGKVRKVELREQMTVKLGLQAVAARKTA